ncbi:MAG: hypothetical protein IT200_06910 [Thermoleophilia bacterium]|nr:hypothetical protein [Thermoleophilia bacterium]
MNDLHHNDPPRPPASKVTMLEAWIARARRAELMLQASRAAHRDTVAQTRAAAEKLGAENLRLRQRLDQAEARRDDAEAVAARLGEELRRLRAGQGKG